MRFSRRGEEERDYFGVEKKGGKGDRGESGDAEKRFAFGVVIVKVVCSFFVRVSSFALGFELFFKASVFCVFDVLLTCLFFLSFFLANAWRAN